MKATLIRESGASIESEIAHPTTWVTVPIITPEGLSELVFKRAAAHDDDGVVYVETAERPAVVAQKSDVPAPAETHTDVAVGTFAMIFAGLALAFFFGYLSTANAFLLSVLCVLLAYRMGRTQ
jgi:hypothetical protein